MFLATTADERLWSGDQTERMLFLGQWCLLPNRRHAWSPRLHAVTDYPFDDRRHLEATYNELQGTHAVLLRRLASALNVRHGTAYSERYWNIAIGYWLRQFVELLFERRACLLRAAIQGASRTRVPADLDAIVPANSDRAEELQVTDRYNAQLYGQLLEQLRIPGIAVESVSLDDHRGINANARTLDARRLLKDAVRTISVLCARRSRYVLVSSYLPPRLALALGWRLKSVPVPDMPRNIGETPTAIDASARMAIGASPPADNDFLSAAQALAARNLPKIFLEDYRDARRVVAARFPRRPSLIATANAFATNDLFKIWAAGHVETGVPLALLQHGGSYGTNRWNGSEDYEIAIADRFYSFGWSDPRKAHVIPWDGPRLRRPISRSRARRHDSILWIGWGAPRYAYRMYAIPTGPHYLIYADEQVRFARTVSDAVASRLQYRPYPVKYGWEEVDALRKARPAITVLSANQSLNRQLGRARLCVSGYNATAFLETFVTGIPTVLFWNPSFWEVRDEAAPYFDRLREARVLHDTPEAAAAFIATVADDPFTWWNEPLTTAAVAAFCDRYARAGTRTTNDWHQEFVRLAGNRDRTEALASGYQAAGSPPASTR